MIPTSKRALYLALAIFWIGLPALAGTATVSGTLAPGGPTMNPVPLISTPNCTGGTFAFDVLYAVYPLVVSANGTYDVTEPGANSAVYLLEGSFDPAAVVNTCIAASNTNPISFSEALSTGVQYYVVVIDDTFDQAGLAYTLTVTGPGNVILGPIPSVIEIPTLSTWGLALLCLLLASGGLLALRRRLPA